MNELEKRRMMIVPDREALEEADRDHPDMPPTLKLMFAQIAVLDRLVPPSVCIDDDDEVGLGRLDAAIREHNEKMTGAREADDEDPTNSTDDREVCVYLGEVHDEIDTAAKKLGVSRSRLLVRAWKIARAQIAAEPECLVRRFER